MSEIFQRQMGSNEPYVGQHRKIDNAKYGPAFRRVEADVIEREADDMPRAKAGPPVK